MIYSAADGEIKNSGIFGIIRNKKSYGTGQKILSAYQSGGFFISVNVQLGIIKDKFKA